MADDLEPINQVFRADMDPYLQGLKAGQQEAKQFAADNRLADESLKELVTASREQTAMLKQMRDTLVLDRIATNEWRDANVATANSVSNLRDRIAAENAVLDSLFAHTNAVGTAQSKMRDSAATAGTAIGHLRDQAIAAAESAAHLRDDAAEAALSVKELGTQSDRTAAKLDLMGLSGASTLTSLGPLLGMIGALVVAASAVAPAALAAGAGLGAFGAFAIPAISSIASGYTKLTTAQAAYQNATTAAARSTALAHIKQAWAGMSPEVAGAVREIQAFKTQFTSLAQSSGITKSVFADVQLIFGTLQKLLPVLVPLAQQGAIAFHNMLSSLSGSVGSSGFINFMHLLTTMVVPAVAAISHLSGAIMGTLGNALTQLAPLSIPFINLITLLVKSLSGPLSAALKVAVALLLGLGQAISPLLPGLSQIATTLITDVGVGFQSFIPILSQVVSLLGGSLLKILKDIEPVLANFITPNSPFMFALQLLPTLLRAILPLFTGLASLLAHPLFAQIVVDVISFLIVAKQVIAVLGLVSKAFGLLGLAFEATPVGWIVTAIAALVFVFYELWNHCAAFRNFWKGLWADIKGILAPVVSWIHNVIADMSRWWSDHGKTVIAIVKTAWLLISTYIKLYLGIVVAVIKAELAIAEGVFRAIWDSIRIVTTTVWKVITTLVSANVKIIQQVIDLVLNLIHGHWAAAWGNLKTIASTYMNAIVTVIRTIASGFMNLLFTAGKDLIQGLINGVMSMWGSVTNLLGGLGHAISNIFSSALSIFSPSRVFFQHGLMLMLGLAQGIASGAQYAKSAMSSVAGAMAPAGVPSPAMAYGASQAASAAAPAAAAAGAPGNITVLVDGQKLFTVMQGQTYRYNVRNSGTVTGVVKPGVAA